MNKQHDQLVLINTIKDEINLNTYSNESFEVRIGSKGYRVFRFVDKKIVQVSEPMDIINIEIALRNIAAQRNIPLDDEMQPHKIH